MNKPSLKDGFDGKPGWDDEVSWVKKNKKYLFIGAIVILVIGLALFGGTK